MTTYRFDDQLAMSWGTAADELSLVLYRSIPGAVSVTQSSVADDRSGTDFWVAIRGGRKLSVDVKRRPFDPIDRYNSDDLVIEWLSVAEDDVPGWTVDDSKVTDYVVYWFEPTRRYAICPYVLLRAAAQENQAEWRLRYGTRTDTATQRRDGSTYHTHWTPVPRTTVWRAMYELAHGRAA